MTTDKPIAVVAHQYQRYKWFLSQMHVQFGEPFNVCFASTNPGGENKSLGLRNGIAWILEDAEKGQYYDNVIEYLVSHGFILLRDTP